MAHHNHAHHQHRRDRVGNAHQEVRRQDTVVNVVYVTASPTFTGLYFIEQCLTREKTSPMWERIIDLAFYYRQDWRIQDHGWIRGSSRSQPTAHSCCQDKYSCREGFPSCRAIESSRAAANKRLHYSGCCRRNNTPA